MINLCLSKFSEASDSKDSCLDSLTLSGVDTNSYYQ